MRLLLLFPVEQFAELVDALRDRADGGPRAAGVGTRAGHATAFALRADAALGYKECVGPSLLPMPTTPIRRIRFPDGDVEYRTTRGELPLGTVLVSRGVHWRVVRYDGETALVALADARGSRARTGSAAAPSPLGPEPPTLEVMTSA